MNICTIITQDWLDRHLVRWVRYVRQNVPDVRLYLIYAGRELTKVPVLAEFEKLHCYGGPVNRWWLNSVRMGATTLFDVPEILYLDADCDVLADISDIPTLSDKSLMCVKSPVVHEASTRASMAMGRGAPSKVMNNGLLYMRKDFSDEYAAAWERLEKFPDVARDRIRGTVAFNEMLAETEYFELPYKYGAIWWDTGAVMDASIVQYCNDNGQSKREHLEGIWRNSR